MGKSDMYIITKRKDLEEVIREKTEDYIKENNRLVQDNETFRKENIKLKEKLIEANKTLKEYIQKEFKEVYKELYELNTVDCYIQFFNNNGGFFYFYSQFYGYMKRCTENSLDVDEKIIKRIVGHYIIPFQNCLVSLRGSLQRHRDNAAIVLEEALNMHGFEGLDETLKLKEQVVLIKKQTEEKHQDMNFLFYSQLWEHIEPLIEQIENGCFDHLEEKTAEVAIVYIQEYLSKLTKAFEEGGLAIIESPSQLGVGNAEDDYFISSQSIDFATPLVMRKTDGYVFIKGILPVTL